MSKHPKVLKINEVEVDAIDLAVALAGLDYTALSEYVNTLGIMLRADADADEARGREMLAHRLKIASQGLMATATFIEDAGNLCKPYNEAEAKSAG